MKEQKLTERRNVSMDADMAKIVDDVRHESRVKSDSEVIRAAIQIASFNKDIWLLAIEANKTGVPDNLAEALRISINEHMNEGPLARESSS